MQAAALAQVAAVYGTTTRARCRSRWCSRAPAGCWRWRSTGTTASPTTRQGSELPEHRQPADRRRRRRRRLPGRLDVQDVHHARRAGGRAAARHRLRRARPSWPPATPASGPGSCDGYWCPGNANPSWMDGYRTMWDGFGRSVNTYFVWLEQQVGADKAVEMAQRLGITFRAPTRRRLRRDTPPTGARSPSASPPPPRWTWPTPTPPWPRRASTARRCRSPSVTDAAGQAVAVASPSCQPVIDPDVARRGHRRGPLPGRASSRRSTAATAAPRPRSPASSAAGRWPARPAARSNNATETFVGVHPAGRRGRHRRQPGQPPPTRSAPRCRRR